ncbi:MAG: alanine racemase [Alphaproteobacteria bacterium]
MSRAAIAILSTENLLHNLNIIKQHASNSKIIAMVKANAYGHGIRSVAQRLEKHVYSFGVASIDEALALRKIGIKIPITLMEGVFEIDELLIAACQKFHVVFHEETQLEWLKASNLPLPIYAWIKIDTGMGRIGFTPARAKEIYQEFLNNKNIQQPPGIMSHLACADEVTHHLNKKQINAFNEVVKDLPGSKSFANSAAIFHFPDSHLDVIRPGLALYGVSPVKGQSASNFNLKPIMNLQTRLIAVKKHSKDSSIGYNSKYICPKEMLIGVIAMGYGDGYPRSVFEGTPILVNGTRCQIVGQVSMDMITIDLSNCPNAKVGDSVTLWGEDLPIEEIANYANRSVYELLCTIQYRIKFHWTMI